MGRICREITLPKISRPIRAGLRSPTENLAPENLAAWNLATKSREVLATEKSRGAKREKRIAKFTFVGPCTFEPKSREVLATNLAAQFPNLAANLAAQFGNLAANLAARFQNLAANVEQISRTTCGNSFGMDLANRA